MTHSSRITIGLLPIIGLSVLLFADASNAQTQRIKQPKAVKSSPSAKPALSTPRTFSPKKLTFKKVNPTFAELKNRVVEVSPGLKMRVGEYVKQSSFKSDPKVARFLTPQFQKKYLKAKPVYREEVIAEGDRLVVKRRLSLKTEDPCAIPDAADKNISVCFKRKNAVGKSVSAGLKKELSDIRRTLKLSKRTPNKFRSSVGRRMLGQADRVAEMDDKQLIEYLLNQADDEKEIYHESILPLEAESVEMVELVPNAVADNQVPAQESAQVTNEKLTFDTTQTTQMEFLNGATWSKKMSDSYQVTFCGSTWFTDRYYAKFSYEVSVGIGLRFPIEVDAKSTITHVNNANGETAYPATGLCNNITSQTAAIHCAKRANMQFKTKGINGNEAYYKRLGVPTGKLFNGKEFVFEIKASGKLYASIPGPNFSKKLGGENLQSKHFTTPMGSGSSSVLADLSLSGKTIGLALQAGAMGVSGWAALNPGIRVTGKNGRIKLPVTSFKNTATVLGNSNINVPTNSWSQPLVLKRNATNTPTSPWGAVVNSPMYEADIVITPTLAIEIGVEVVYWGWNTIIGPFAIDALALDLGAFTFGHHQGTISEYNHYISGCDPGDNECVKSASFVEDQPPTNMDATLAGRSIRTITRGDESSVVTVTNGHWGSWASMEKCQKGTYVRSMALRVESKRGSGDDTALNGIALWCTDREGKQGNLAVSNPGYWGDWGDFSSSCKQQGDFVRAGQIKLQSKRGGSDDSAANSFTMLCKDLDKLETNNGGEWGTWYNHAMCGYNEYVCGIQTRIEKKQGDGDDTALNGVKLQCCKAN